MAQEYEIIKGFQTQNGWGLYDYESLANKPDLTTLSMGTRKYVEDFKTEKNNWNQAFEELFSYCKEKNYIACTGNNKYSLTAPLYIGDIDVDFENCELTYAYEAKTEEEQNTQACVILTGAEKRIQRFGTITGRGTTGILINTQNGKYKYNKVYAKLIQGRYHALNITTTNNACYFNEFHILLLKSTKLPLKVYSKSKKTKWVNECYFYLGSIEGYRTVELKYYPDKLIEITNATRCNIYNVDLECGQIETPLSDGSILPADPDHTIEVELIDCSDIAFYNPRTKEGTNTIQFKFVGESYDNYIDAEYSKYGTIDSSQMVNTHTHYNIWRGRVVTSNGGSVTNANTLRIYKDFKIPEVLSPMTKDIVEDYVFNSDTLQQISKVEGNISIGGIPTLLRWYGGDIIIDKTYLALLPTSIKIVRMSNGVGNILDTENNIVIRGSDLEINKIKTIIVNKISYAKTEAIGENNKTYLYINSADLITEDIIIPDQNITYEFVDGFIRFNGTQSTVSVKFKHTNKIDYIGGSLEFRSITASDQSTWSVIAFFDINQNFLGNIETALGGSEVFFEQYNTKEYAKLIGKNSSVDVVAGIITAQQILEWYPSTAYVAVSCPTTYEAYNIPKVFEAIEIPYLAKQIYISDRAVKSVNGIAPDENGNVIVTPTFSEQDKQEIIDSVLSALPTWSGGEY